LHLVAIPPNTGDDGVREGIRLSLIGLVFDFLLLPVVAVVVAAATAAVVFEAQVPRRQLVRLSMDYVGG
jgi:hypothetical protein